MRFAALIAAMFLAGTFVSTAQRPAASSESPSWESLPDAPAVSQPQQQATNAQPDRLSVGEVVQPQSGLGSGGSSGRATAVAVTTYSTYQPVYSSTTTSTHGTVRYVATRAPVRNTVRAGVGVVRRVASLPVRVAQNIRARRAARSAAYYYQPQYFQQAYQPQVSYTSTTATCDCHYVARWTHPSSIQDHLANDHGVSTAGKTQAQMLAEHDAIHDVIGPVYSVKPKQAPPDPYYQTTQRPAFPTVNNCPGGVCPLPRRDCR